MKLIEIASTQNPRYKSWIKGLEGRGIKKSGEAIFAGKTFLRETLEQFPHRVLAILARNTEEILPFVNDKVDFSSLPPVYILPKDLFANLDIYGTNAPLLLISAPEPEPWPVKLEPGLTLFLPFQNPINLGTIIRSAAAMGASVVVLKEAANLYHPKTLRAAGPAIFQTKLWRGPDLPALAKLLCEFEFSQLPIFALSPKGENLFKFNFPTSIGLVAGPEGPGLDDVWPASKRLSIPMQAGVESLNAAAAVDMAMGCLFAHWQK